MRICVLGDAYHCERAEQESVDFKTADGLKAFNKNKKLIKKFGTRVHANATDSALRRGLPHPSLTPARPFPARRALRAQRPSTTPSSPPRR
jgi:large subunit ribosomal protein L10Ae